jgi:hypothetical protein
VQQLELFSFEELTPQERKDLLHRIRGAYWHLRNLRGGRFGQAARRRHYRYVADIKKRLQLAGVSKRQILDFLACCRGGCKVPERGEPCLACAPFSSQSNFT